MGTLITAQQLTATAEKLATIGANIEITSDAKIPAASVEKIIKTAILKNLHVTVNFRRNGAIWFPALRSH